MGIPMKINDGVSQIMLERYVSGELSEAQVRQMEAQLSQDPDLMARVAEIRQHNADYLAAHPVDVAYRAVCIASEKASKPEKPRLLFPVFVPGAVTIAFLVFLVLPQILPFAEPFTEKRGYDDIRFDEIGDIRLKGLEPRLNVYKKIDDELKKLGNNAVATNNEIIQLSYVAGEMTYGVIFSIDGRGSVTLHFPENIGEPTRLDSEGEISLEHAYQLDDAPEFERFFFVASGSEIAVPDVLLAAQKLADGKIITGTGRLDLDENIQQKVVSIIKSN